MSEELQAQLAAFLGAMLDAVKSGGERAAGQMPQLVQEKLLYAIVTQVIILVGVTVLLLVVARLLRSQKYRHWVECVGGKKDACGTWRDANGYMADRDGRLLSRVILWTVWLYLGGIGWLAAATSLLKPLITPRLYIIEWLSSLVR